MVALDTFKDQLDELLRGAFAGGVTELEIAPRSEQVSGFLIWDGFQDERQLDRQRRLWQTLRDKLPLTDQKRITAVLTVTPDEMRSLREVE